MTIVTLLAVLASIATMVGLFTRDRREFRQSPTQARAGQELQTATSVLWLLATGLMAGFFAQSNDIGRVMYGWPGPSLLIGSALALVATILSFATIPMVPAIWRGGRRVDSWTSWRKLRFSLTSLIFVGFSLLLAYWGALEPWSG